MDIGTPLGLAFASGVNAYFPLLSFAITVRFFHLDKVNPNFAFVTSNWCIVALVILTILDFVADKIPVVDHTWDALHAVIRPIMGALVAAASYGQFPIPAIKTSSAPAHSLTSQTFVTLASLSHVWATVATPNAFSIGGTALLIIVLIIGGLLAAMSHTTKATARLASTLTTAGLFNIVLSFAEDILVVIIVLLSLFIPVVVLILLGLFLIVFGSRFFRIWSKRASRSRSLL